MPARGDARLRACAIAGALALAACTPSAGGPVSPPAGRPGANGSPTASASPRARNAVKIFAPRHGSFLVRGEYPTVRSSCKRHEQPVLRARYPGRLAIRRSSDGTLSLTVTLPFESYLEGIAEMPPSWPMAALEAQAIAARSYALASTGWSGSQGETLDTPICATTSCQVYAGIPVQPSPDVRRWYRAVRRTAGEVLLYDGRPADTVYFSTSNGHTYGNEDVFGSSPLPYLRPVVEHDDGASPVSHWRVVIPYGDLAEFLSAAGDWPSGRAITNVEMKAGRVIVSGGRGPATMDLSTFRDDVNGSASCLKPGRYPPGGLPTTIPSSWLTMTGGAGAVTITGRGWGHGVGMVQWGAYGKSLRGWSATRILAYYYGGLQPQRFPEPGLIHVQVASGLTSLRIVPSAAGARIRGEELPRGPILVSGGDALHVTPPEG